MTLFISSVLPLLTYILGAKIERNSHREKDCFIDLVEIREGKSWKQLRDDWSIKHINPLSGPNFRARMQSISGKQISSSGVKG